MATLAEEKPALRHLSSIDGGLVMSVLLLSAIGLATVHSASSEMPVDYLPRQALWLGIGVLLLVAAMSIDYHLLLDFSIVLYGVGLVLLVLGGMHFMNLYVFSRLRKRGRQEPKLATNGHE